MSGIEFASDLRSQMKDFGYRPDTKALMLECYNEQRRFDSYNEQ